MSYLNPVRLQFAGDFRADVSTVNNDPAHFNNPAFLPKDRMPGPGATNGWWQPEGTGAWRLSDCKITGCGFADGTSGADPVIGMAMRDSGDRVSAKLVDLDPEQQSVSTIFGLQMRITADDETVLVSGDFESTGIWDMWFRAAGQNSDIGISCVYQSVLTNVTWGDVSKSKALTDLKNASLPRRLSVKFMLDGFAMGGARRGYGRIVGTIGPSLANEPDHFVLGRHLAAPPQQTQTFDQVHAWHDPKGGRLWVDFGNAIQTQVSGGPLQNSGDLHVVVGDGKGGVIDLGALAPYTAKGWYEATAAIQAFPPDRRLSVAEQAAVQTSALAVVAGPIAPGATWASLTPLSAEPSDGLFCRPDDFVMRLEPTIPQTARVQVSRFGAAIGGQTIVPAITGNGIGGGPPVAVPLKAVKLRPVKPTDKDGWAYIPIDTTDPNNPRGFIDGQLYALEVRVKGAVSAGTDFDSGCFVSILLFNAVKPVGKPLWPDVLPVFQQYANLYPRPHGPDRYVPFAARPPLHPVVNLADYDAVAGYAKRIHDALLLPFEHPNHMPVVRDLSDGKRALLLKFLDRVMAGEDVRGPPIKPAKLKAMAVAAAAPPTEDGFDPGLGGKTMAMQRINRRAPTKPTTKS
jgi:hypothetical protein